MGIQQMEYGGLAAAHTPSMGAFTATSQAFSVAAGRLSFVFGFKGPAVRFLADTPLCISAECNVHAITLPYSHQGARVVMMLLHRQWPSKHRLQLGMLTSSGQFLS